MALSNKDIERVGEIMGARLAEQIKPIELLLEKHSQTLYGATGNNGLNGDMREMRKRIGRMEKISYAAQTLLAGAIAFKDRIFG